MACTEVHGKDGLKSRESRRQGVMEDDDGQVGRAWHVVQSHIKMLNLVTPG